MGTALDKAYTLLKMHISDRIGIITLNNPKKHNSLSTALIDELCAAFDEMLMNQTRVVILRAQAGAPVFSSGHDVRELPTNGRDPLTEAPPRTREAEALGFRFSSSNCFLI